MPGAVTVQATDPATGLRGRGAGVLDEDGSVVLNVNLSASGTISGTVIGRDSLTPVGVGATVTLRGPVTRVTVTDAFGGYRFDFAPLGVYTVEASDAAGNRGRTQATLTGTNQVIDAPVLYLGRGAVGGRVETATGSLVAGAQVSLSSRSVFGGRAGTTTDALGEYAFSGVFVGPFEVSAVDPLSGLAGFASGQIDAEGQSSIAPITLEPAAALTGTVLRSDGMTPAAGVELRLSPSGRSATTDAAGSYVFAFLPLRTYTVDATDPASGDRQRAVALLESAGQTVTQNLILNGVADVTVAVRDAGGLPVPGAQVIVTSQSVFGGSRQAMTGADGTARLANVLAGAIAGTVRTAEGAGRPLTLRATAFDRAGNQVSDAAVVTILPDARPTVALAQGPAPGSTVIEGTTLRIAAAAADVAPAGFGRRGQPGADPGSGHRHRRPAR